MSELAIRGGKPLLERFDLPEELFRWPIVTEEDEAAVLDVLRRNRASGNEITTQFEQEFAAWNGRKYGVRLQRHHGHRDGFFRGGAETGR